MKRYVLIAGLILPPIAAHADDLQDIKQQLNDAVRDLKARQAAITELSRRVQALEQQKPRGSAPAAKTAKAQTEPPPPVVAAATPPAPPVEDTKSGQLTIDRIAAEDALNRALVQQGFALVPNGSFEIEPGFTFLYNERNNPGFITNTNSTTTVVNNRVKQYNYVGDVAFRTGLPWDSQLEFDIPYRYIEQNTEVTQGGASVSVRGHGNPGFGDVAVGLSKGLLKEGGWKPNLIAGVQYVANSGGFSHDLPLGNNYNQLRGTLTATKSFDPLVIVGQFGFGHGFEAHGFQPGDEYDALVGAALSIAPESSLRFELLQRFFDYGQRNGRIIATSGRTESSFIVGASFIVAPRFLLDFSVGIGLTGDAPDYYFRVGLPIRLNW